MTKKLAIAIIHGAGDQSKDFADNMISIINEEFHKKVKKHHQLIFHPVYWSEVFKKKEENMWEKLKKGGEMDFTCLRHFVIQLLGDGVAYQLTETKNNNYTKIHAILDHSLLTLANQAGPEAPLCIISHSLGSVIASNYFYDLQFKKKDFNKKTNRKSPLESGETLTQFYTLGSPLALWSLRYTNFGRAVKIPSSLLRKYYPNLMGEWLNFYDKDDVLATPLKTLNDDYKASVSKDIEVNAGGLLKSWNPLSHTEYMTNNDVIQPIVNGLVNTWYSINT